MIDNNQNFHLSSFIFHLFFWIMLLGLLLWFSGCSEPSPSFAKEKKEKILKRLKTKTGIHYDIVEKSGEYTKVLKGKTIRQYDDRGNKIEWVHYDADGRLTDKFLSKYDDRGNQIEEAYYGAGGGLREKSLPKYDDKGNLIEWVDYGADGKFTGKSLYKYDDKGNNIEWVHYDADGKLRHKTVHKYDDKGNEIERAWYDYGRLCYKAISKYDDQGNQIEEAFYGADGKLKDKFLYKYKYDDKGNKTEQVDYKIEEESGKVQEIPVSQTVWEYEFYPEPKNEGK